jgi:catechol 2,3-dioxygenase-like lactoylglutathione lyase family enzyme
VIAATHTLIFSEDAAATRAFFRDIFGWENVDNGEGWLIFALPPAELGVHPGDTPRHELFLMCHDIERTKAELEAKGVTFTAPVEDQGFGLITRFEVPGAGELQLYQPTHESPLAEFSRREH